ncbi:MAG: long-chain fatty acid--CoA ligase [Pseudomonadota bacterium]
MEKLWLKSYAPNVPQTLDFEKIVLSDALKRSAERFPDNPALLFQGTTVTFRRLDELVSRFAAGLESLGVKPGDKVAVLMPNLVQTVVAYYGAMRAGAVLVMNNPLYTDRELQHQFNDSGSTYLVCLDLLAPRMIKLRESTGIHTIISCHIRDYLPFLKKHLFRFVRKGMHLDTPQAPKVHEFMDLVNNNAPIASSRSGKWDDTAVLLYTGGTTGVSKGVELTHANLSSNCQQCTSWFPGFAEGREIAVGCLPFFHSFGMTTAMNMSMFQAWSVVLIPKPEPKTILEAISTYKATYIPAVPTLYNGMINFPELKNYSIESLLGCFSGGAPMPLETIRRFEQLTGAQICEGYGLTETTPVTHINPYGGATKVGTIGLPLPNTEAKLVNVDDYNVEITTPGESGELCIKGPQVMKGYINRPEETATALRDGWLLTGDIAVIDEEGYFTIVDRKKDMIITGGFNVYPRDVEEVLFTHPKVSEACVIGIPDSHSGERIKAFVTLKAGETATEEEVIAFCRERLTKYKVPKFVDFVSDLPKSAVGKILRKELKAREAEKK